MGKLKWASVGAGVRWNRLRSARKNAGLTIGELCERAHVNEAQVSRIECGKEGLISRACKEKLVAFFGCDYGDLFPSAMSGNEPVQRVFSTTLDQLEEDAVPYIDSVPCEPAPAKKAARK